MSTHEEDLAFLKKTGQIASAPKPKAKKAVPKKKAKKK